MLRIGLMTIAFVFGAAALKAGAPSAQAHDPYFRTVDTPLCTDTAMLKKIQHRFRHQARHMLQMPELAISDMVDVHEHRFEPQDVHRARPIPRRYCHATALLNDGGHRKIWFLIEGGAGFASVGSNVEFCLSGFDRWNVYNGACRILR